MKEKFIDHFISFFHHWFIFLKGMIFVLGGFLFLGAGCQFDLEKYEAPSHNACLIDQDCSKNETCNNYLCYTRCGTVNICKTGFQCNNGLCFPVVKNSYVEIASLDASDEKSHEGSSEEKNEQKPKDIASHRCGDGHCDFDETCVSCSNDCPCKVGYICAKNVAKCQIHCGNGVCDRNEYGENCGTCPKDCKCSTNFECRMNTCVKIVKCGDNICDPSENCQNCVNDCHCTNGKVCNPQGGCGIPCGDGKCDPAENENCATCSIDCACPADKVCNSLQKCVCKTLCNGKVCGPDGCGSVCGTCNQGERCNSKGQCVCDKQQCPNINRTQCKDNKTEQKCVLPRGEVCRTWKDFPCPQDQSCSNSIQKCCQPNCSNKECGSDGCGGQCSSSSCKFGCNSNMCKRLLKVLSFKLPCKTCKPYQGSWCNPSISVVLPSIPEKSAGPFMKSCDKSLKPYITFPPVSISQLKIVKILIYTTKAFKKILILEKTFNLSSKIGEFSKTDKQTKISVKFEIQK